MRIKQTQHDDKLGFNTIARGALRYELYRLADRITELDDLSPFDERRAAHRSGDWHFLVAVCDVYVVGPYVLRASAHAWGVPSDSTDRHFRALECDLIQDAERALGVELEALRLLLPEPLMQTRADISKMLKADKERAA